MAPTAEMMIHNPVSEAYGDYREMQSAGERLRVSKETILNAYEIKTRLPRDELAALMDAETWMDAKAALEKGFVDEILYADGLLGVANSAALPPLAELIRRRDELLREPTEDLDALRAGAEALALV